MIYSKYFICYDGELKDNKYYLLGNSEKYVYNKKGLTFAECFTFLTQKTRQKKIIFNLHFDLQFWIRSWKDDKILALMNSQRVHYRQYELTYFPNKMLIIKKGNSLFKIYDILSFFNKSLLAVIDQLKIKLTKEEQEILNLGKKNRGSNFDKMSKAEVIYYNKTECVITEKIAGKIKKLLNESTFTYKNKNVNLDIVNFYGSSAVSSKILKTYKVDKINNHPKYREIFEQAYYGGRFECLQLGEFKNVYKYDINSAYPYVMKDLHKINKFRKVKNPKVINDKGIYYIYFKMFYPKDFICPFPLRHNSGRIFYTGEVEGWYFGCEINEFINSGINEENYILNIKEGLVPEFSKQKIFEKYGNNVIEEVYNQRIYYKENNDLRHYIYKISLNAVYGKLAQITGKAQFQNLYFAGYITAKTRSMLYNLSYTTNYNNIIAYATDSILSKKPLKVKCNSDLGNWDFEFCKKVTVLMSGFYKIELKDNKYVYGIRGFKRLNNFDKIYNDILKKGFSKISYNQFISHKLFLHSPNAYKDERLKFTKVSKIINPVKANFKRIYHFDNRYNSPISEWFNLPVITSINRFKQELKTEIYVDY